MLKVSLFLISMGAVGATLLGSKPQPTPVNDSDQKTANLQVSPANASKLEVSVPLGEVLLVADNSTTVNVHVVRSAKSPLDAESKRWMRDSYVTAENHGGVLSVKEHPFGKDSLKGISSSQSKDSKGKGRNLDLKVEIHVPSNLDAKLSMTAGKATVQGHFRKLTADVSAGELTLNGVKCQLNQESHVGAGEIKVVLPSGANADVSADVSVGEISGLPSSAKRSEGVHFGDRRHGKTGNGESKVRIHVGAGSIKVESRDRIIASSLADDEPAAMEEKDEVKELSDVDFSDKDLDRTVQESIREAMKAVKESLGSLHSDMKIELGENQPDVHMNLDNIDESLEKALAQIGPDIEKAMKLSKPEFEKAMKEFDAEMKKAMKASKPDIDKAMKEAEVEIKKAMKTMKPEMEKALKSIKPEIEKALREAMKELEKANRELKKHHDD